MTEGFLGTAAPRYADLILLLEVAMGAGLLIGAGLARARRFRAHAWCQSGIVLLNLAVIVLVMIPSFRAHVSAGIPLKLGKAYYAFATVHGALGAIAEVAALYILLAAGTSIVPPRFRITRYKLWMRTLLVLWWVVILSGLALYARWYVPDWWRLQHHSTQAAVVPQLFRPQQDGSSTEGSHADVILTPIRTVAHLPSADVWRGRCVEVGE